MICPSERQIVRLLAAERPGPDLAALREHARTCSTCAAALERGVEEVLLEVVSGPDAHPESEALSRYLDGGAGPLDLAVRRHLARCDFCRDRLEIMRGGRTAAAERPVEVFTPHSIAAREPSSRFPYALAASVVLALALGYLAWRGLQPRTELRDGALSIARLDGDLQVRGGSAQDRALVREKLGSDGAPRALVSLPPVPRTLGGPADLGTVLVVQEPLANEALESPDVRIRWEPAAGAETYRVQLYRDPDMETVVWRATTRATSAAAKLSRGGNYVLTISARISESEAMRYAPPVAFRVLPEDEAAAVARATAAVGGSHLLRGIVYEKHRMFTPALSEYRQLAESNPRSLLAERIYATYRGTVTGR